MSVCEWFATLKFADYKGLTEGDDRRMWWSDSLIGDPLPPLANWQPPNLTQYLGENGKRKPRPIGDSPSSGTLRLISQHAADALADVWQRHALLYPVILDDADKPFYMVVVQTDAGSALDRKASKGKLRTYSGNPEHFVTLHEWVFDEAKLSGQELFRIPDITPAYYVTEAFKQRVIDAKLKGFCLKRHFWEEKPFVS